MILPDLLAPELKLVFCGTAASAASARAKAYYAKPGNKFWPTLCAVGITPRLFAPHEFSELLALGIGLTDLCKTESGNDAELSLDAFDVKAARAKFRRYRPATVAFTSKTAAEAYFQCPVEYGWQTGAARTRFFVLPSPSGLATRYFDIARWQELADAINQRRT